MKQTLCKKKKLVSCLLIFVILIILLDIAWPIRADAAGTEYDIYYSCEGGEIFGDYPTTYISGVGAILPTDVRRTGYEFTGWYRWLYSAAYNEKPIVTAISPDDWGIRWYIATWKLAEYSISLDPCGGTIGSGNVSGYTYGESVTLPTDVTREGYTFEGWYTGSDGSGSRVEAISSGETGNKAFYAKWNPITYSVTLKSNGGTIRSGNVTAHTSGETTALPTDVTREGYAFGGWYENSSFGGNPIAEISGDTYGDKTYYAKWTANTYRVTLFPNGGSIRSGSVTAYTYGEGAALPTDVEKEGYSFEGWYGSSAFSGTAVTAVSKTETGDKSFFAKWKANVYTVTLDACGGTIRSGDVTSHTSGETVTLPTNVTRPGYSFEGWYGSRDYSGSPVTGISATTYGNQTYYAKWKEKLYGIALYPNGGTIRSGNVTSYSYGNGAALPTDVEKEGYSFEGWYGSSAFSGTPVTAVSKTETGDKSFFAKWKANTYTVVLDACGGTIRSGNVTAHTSGEAVTLPTEVTRRGCVFAGWYEHSDYSGSPVTGISATTYGDKTYYAKWLDNHFTVSLVLNGGTLRSKAVTEYVYGRSVTLPTEVEQDGYLFGGWYESSSCKGASVTAISATDYGDKTFYAKWNEKKYSVTLNPNGGTVLSGSIEAYEYGKGASLPTEVTRDGYRFGGWYESDAYSGSAVSRIGAEESGDKVFYAKWVPEEYSITYITNGGTLTQNAVTKYTFGVGCTLPSDVTHPGFIFEGWFADEACRGAAVTAIPPTATGDMTFYARWKLEEIKDEKTLEERKEELTENLLNQLHECDEESLSVLIQDITKQIEAVSLEDADQIQALYDSAMSEIALSKKRQHFRDSCTALLSELEMDWNYSRETIASLQALLDSCTDRLEACKTEEALAALQEEWQKAIDGLRIYRLETDGNVLFCPGGMSAGAAWTVTDAFATADEDAMRTYLRHDRYRLFAAYELDLRDADVAEGTEFEVTLQLPDGYCRGRNRYVLLHETAGGTLRRVRYTDNGDGTVTFDAEDMGTYSMMTRENPSLWWGVCPLLLSVVVVLLVTQKKKKSDS